MVGSDLAVLGLALGPVGGQVGVGAVEAADVDEVLAQVAHDRAFGPAPHAPRSAGEPEGGGVFAERFAGGAVVAVEPGDGGVGAGGQGLLLRRVGDLDGGQDAVARGSSPRMAPMAGSAVSSPRRRVQSVVGATG